MSKSGLSITEFIVYMIETPVRIFKDIWYRKDLDRSRKIIAFMGEHSRDKGGGHQGYFYLNDRIFVKLEEVYGKIRKDHKLLAELSRRCVKIMGKRNHELD